MNTLRGGFFAQSHKVTKKVLATFDIADMML